MLVLSRKIDERIVIAEDIVVTVVGVHSGQVRLGFEAPEDIAIRREELMFESPRERCSREGERGEFALPVPK